MSFCQNENNSQFSCQHDVNVLRLKQIQGRALNRTPLSLQPADCPLLVTLQHLLTGLMLLRSDVAKIVTYVGSSHHAGRMCIPHDLSRSSTSP